MNLLTELQNRFQTALAKISEEPEKFSSMIRPAQDRQFGDFQANCAMPLAKVLKKPPRDVASEICEHLNVADFCEAPEIAGPGFINLTLKPEWLTEQINEAVNDERFGVEKVLEPKNIIVDFSSPNVAKPMHVGHLRSSVIGDSICRVLKFLGHSVKSDNHIGDWGTQFGMIIYGYKHFLDEASYKKEPVAELARLYRLVNQISDYHAAVESLPNVKQQIEESQKEIEALESSLKEDDKKGKKQLKRLRSDFEKKKQSAKDLHAKIEEFENDKSLLETANAHKSIAKDARLETAKLHSGDEENLKLWNQFMPICLDAMQVIYDRLNVEFDMTLGESHYQPQLGSVVEQMKSKGVAVDSEGAVCVFIEGNAAPFLIQKADGAFTYGTTDLATVQSRVDDLNSDSIIYVVDTRQGEHFRLLFETVRIWGYNDVELKHVNFGTVMGKDKKPFKTRSGDNVSLGSLLDEAITRARVIVDENDDGKEESQLDESQRQTVAKIVGIGGIKYADLKHNRESDYVFDWEKMLAKTGNTATYIQYAYARIAGIFRKGEFNRSKLRTAKQPISLNEPNEVLLAKQLLSYQEVLDGIGQEYQPHLLTQYLFETAETFSSFYVSCPVLKAENEEDKVSRLMLSDLTARILQHGLSLLGIDTAEQM